MVNASTCTSGLLSGLTSRDDTKDERVPCSFLTQHSPRQHERIRSKAVIIDEARVDEADVLTRLALASKQYWGYDDDFIEQCRSELIVDANDIESDRVFVARDNAGVLGFYVMRSMDESREELDMLFVEPAFIGRGVGGELMLHAIDAARESGASVIVIVSDPYAAPFYEHCGGELVGSSVSSSTGRTLPVYEVPLYSR